MLTLKPGPASQCINNILTQVLYWLTIKPACYIKGIWYHKSV